MSFDLIIVEVTWLVFLMWTLKDYTQKTSSNYSSNRHDPAWLWWKLQSWRGEGTCPFICFSLSYFHGKVQLNFCNWDPLLATKMKLTWLSKKSSWMAREEITHIMFYHVYLTFVKMYIIHQTYVYIYIFPKQTSKIGCALSLKISMWLFLPIYPLWPPKFWLNFMMF